MHKLNSFYSFYMEQDQGISHKSAIINLKNKASEVEKDVNFFHVKEEDRKMENLEDEESSSSRNILTPANPIIDKNKLPDELISVKLLDNQRNHLAKKPKYLSQSLSKTRRQKQQIQKPLQLMNLFTGYDQQNLLYRKFDNREFYQLNKKKYFASIFFPIYLRENNKFTMSVSIPPFQGMRNQACFAETDSLICNVDQELDFNSNFESGNLFAVFKTGQWEYDLVLQNDMNTPGCTQWFYFSVNNKKNKDIKVKFNIVNLVTSLSQYKAASLYNKGMKPMVFSSNSSKGWKRKGQQIYYEKNCIQRQGSSKYYSSLSFCYDFTKENDNVQFAHAIPYSYTRLLQLMKTVETSKKCVVKSLGVTPLKKTIPIIKFESQDPRIQKRAIIIMARQHPGEVQGSFAIEQILLSFLKSSSQIDFLLWRFNVYIIPMINVDGVFLGSYRCNAMGHDLNRNWEGEQKSKHPEIVYIKTQIKKIMTKYPIQLILDLHGHSNKMNSFFYGNPFGPNPYVFPFVAAKNSPFITFQDCTFSIQKKQKAKTARSVLGNMIKQTGNVYTYEMSFYGGIKNGKIINFYEQTFKQLGKDLLTAIYKVYVQVYKEEKTLKESLYLKQIRKEISKIQGEFYTHQNSGSDSQAQQDRDDMERQRKQELQQKLKQLLEQRSKGNLEDMNNLRQSEQLGSTIDINQATSKFQSFSEEKSESLYESPPITQRLQRNKSMKQSTLESVIFNYDESLQQKLNKHRQYAKKLKIYGQNYLPKQGPSSQVQCYSTLERQPQKSMIKVSSIFEDRGRQAMRMNFVYKSKNYRNRNQNYSTIQPIKSQFKDQESLINDIVKVNRLQYKKIEREKDKLKMQKSLEKKASNKGVFKLPSIINNFKY